MGVSIKEIKKRPERLASGHRACPGCTAPAVLRHAMKMTEDNIVISIATGCMEVSTSIYPYTSWKVSMIHSAFENAAATMSGVEAAYEKLHRDGKVKEKFKFICFGGDGGTYDIGFQSLSGAMERGHDMLYICYDNQAYMNTGVQRSSATPFGAATNTSQAGSVKQGKEQHRKDMTAIMAYHNLPYVGQAAIHKINDMRRKIEKGLETKGACFLNVLAPCHRGWYIPIDGGLDSSELATETCFWPLYEVEDGKWTLNYKPKEKLPITEWLKPQGRFKHLFKPENAGMLVKIQEYVDRKWDEIRLRCGEPIE